MLYRTSSLDGQSVRELVIPESDRTLAFKAIHSDTGYLGTDKSV